MSYDGARTRLGDYWEAVLQLIWYSTHLSPPYTYQVLPFKIKQVTPPPPSAPIAVARDVVARDVVAEMLWQPSTSTLKHGII